MSATLVIRHMW